MTSARRSPRIPSGRKEYGERLGHDCKSRRAGEAGISVPDLSPDGQQAVHDCADRWCSIRAEIKKPDGERLAQFHDANLQSLKFQMLSPAPITKDTEKLFMKTALNLGEEKLGKDDAYVQAVLNGGPVDATVDSMVDGTKLGDVAVRKALMDGGEAAIAASTDPMIVAARRVDPIVRESQRKMRDTIASVLTPAGEKLGKARFLVYGKNAYPDATFTLRLSYGTVDGYPYNGTIAPPFTTYYGLYDRADSFSNKAPFNLTPKEEAGLSKLNLATPLDFVSTGDIIGGNSGSPVVNREGELVGLIFDGNIESLAGDFVYDGTRESRRCSAFGGND